MNQNTLFHEDIYDALNTDIMACGGKKVVGNALRPKLAVNAAGEWVANCLNRTRAEKFDAEDILFIKTLAKQAGSFATYFFEADQIGMTHALPIEPEDEKARLQREFINAVGALKSIETRLGKLA